MDTRLLRRAADLAQRGERAVLVTLVAVEGPAPREPGARMLVFGGGQTEGTIGGGSLEVHAVARAEGLLPSGGTLLETLDLTDRGLKCGGGKATLFYEALVPEAELVIFGAGHVGRALALLARDARAFPVTVYAGRGEPGEESSGLPVIPCPGFAELPALSERSYVVICTNSHATDFAVAEGILRQSPEPAYVGMLGSTAKCAEIRARLQEAGIPPRRVEAVRCPVGLPLGGRSPGLVALSILAEIVAFHHRQLADAGPRLKGRAS